MWIYVNGVIYNTNSFDLIEAVEVQVQAVDEEGKLIEGAEPQVIPYVRGVLDVTDKKAPALYIAKCETLDTAKALVKLIFKHIEDEDEAFEIDSKLLS